MARRDVLCQIQSVLDVLRRNARFAEPSPDNSQQQQVGKTNTQTFLQHVYGSSLHVYDGVVCLVDHIVNRAHAMWGLSKARFVA